MLLKKETIMQKQNHLIRVVQAFYCLILEITLLLIRIFSALVFWTGYLLQKIGAFGLRKFP
jgi:hypothetical protein